MSAAARLLGAAVTRAMPTDEPLMLEQHDAGRVSLLMRGAGQRLAAALMIVAALWLAVGWAIGMAA